MSSSPSRSDVTELVGSWIVMRMYDKDAIL